MKTIGLIGGTSWVSTIDYYRIINQTVNDRLGNNNSAKILLYSVNFEEIAVFTRQGDWKAIEKILSTAAKNLEGAGADCMLLCANTMHIIAAEVQAAIDIPLIHIADVILKAIKKMECKKVLLLGTKYTMEASFYTDRLQPEGIEIIIPDAAERELINDAIYNELGKGIFLPATKRHFIDIIEKYKNRGAEAVILGCTEIPLIITAAECSIPLFDTLLLHATAAVDEALDAN